jgi:hypothetical protein
VHDVFAVYAYFQYHSQKWFRIHLMEVFPPAEEEQSHNYQMRRQKRLVDKNIYHVGGSEGHNVKEDLRAFVAVVMKRTANKKRKSNSGMDGPAFAIH